MGPLSLSCALQMNSDWAYDKSSSRLNLNPLYPPVQLGTSSISQSAISDITSGSSSILYSEMACSLYLTTSDSTSKSSGYSSSATSAPSSNSSGYSSSSATSAPPESSELAIASISYCVSLCVIQTNCSTDQLLLTHLNIMNSQQSSEVQGSQQPSYRKSLYPVKKTTKNSQRGHKTEPSQQMVRYMEPIKTSRNKMQFSEEYMNLVHKMKVNLSKQHFKTKSKPSIVRERHPYYTGGQDARTKARKIVVKTPSPQESIYSHSVHHSANSIVNGLTHKLEKISVAQKIRRVSMRQSSSGSQQGFLPPVTQLSIQQTKKLLFEQKKVKREQQIRSKKSSLMQSRARHKSNSRQVTLSPRDELSEEEDPSTINPKFGYCNQLSFHCEILMDLLTCIEVDSVEQENSQRVFACLKLYILGNKRVTDQSGFVLVDDVSHLDEVFVVDWVKEEVRQLVLLEHQTMILAIDLLANQLFWAHKNIFSQLIHSFLGIYVYILSLLKEQHDELPNYTQTSFAKLQYQITVLNIHVKKELSATVIFIRRRMAHLLKVTTKLAYHLSLLQTRVQEEKYNINVAFYSLLKQYAVYLNLNEVELQKNYQMLKTFATCPAPYLTQPTSKRYTLVIDCHQTLLHAHLNQGMTEVFLRPYARQFLETLSTQYQIVVFTDDMPQTSTKVLSYLPRIDHVLYRHHTTRLRKSCIKDISRIGRPLNSTVLVDDQEKNLTLQKDNGIKVSEWLGSDRADQELNVLGLFLSKMASQKVGDVRQYLPGFREFKREFL